MKRKLILSVIIVSCFFIVGCSKKYNYNYKDDIISAEIDEEVIKIDNTSENGMIYFYPIEKPENKSYVAYIYRNDNDASQEISEKILSEYKKYMGELYRVSKGEKSDYKENKKEKTAKLSYSLLDDEDNIYSVDTKFINRNQDSIIIVSFIDDSLDNNTKEIFNKLFDSIIINKKDL